MPRPEYPAPVVPPHPCQHEGDISVLNAALAEIKDTLRDIPAQPGAPWDGGGDATPWPELPEV